MKILRSSLRCLVIFTASFVCLISNAQLPTNGIKKEKDGVLLRLSKGMVRIRVCEADLIQVKYTVLDTFPRLTSLVINNPFASPVPFQVNENAPGYDLKTSKLLVRINRQTGSIAYMTADGSSITSEAGEQGKSMQQQTVAGINTYSCTTTFNSPADEALFGLGCHPIDSGAMNYKGRNQDMTIKYLTGAIPVLLSTKGFGLLWDNYSASAFYGAEDQNSKFRYVSESGQQVNYYFFYGPSFDHIINLYRQATGKAPMFPKWAFGLFQSQDRYLSQDEIIGVKNNYRNNHIPVDAIVQDWFYWEPLPIGSHVMNPARYPNPRALVDELHNAHLHAMISIWPVFGKGTPNFNALQRNNGLTSITWDNVLTHTFDSYYDAHSAAARDRYWRQAADSLVIRYGWDAWWVDQCEPDNGALLDERRKAVFAVGKGIDYFNTYSLEHTKGLYEHWRKDIKGKRAVFLVRQAFAGQQRNATTLWSSDIPCSFPSFKIQVPQGINACASGIPYWTSDIGGYHFHWQAPDWSQPDKQELFIRWFQFGAFCPIFRIHGKGERALFSKNWSAQTKEILLSYDQLRYRLLPYVYSLAGDITHHNYTLMRALSFDFRNDPKVFSIPDEYMFGPAFLVNPVTSQMYSGKDSLTSTGSRKVYLPEGTAWYDFWTGGKLEGGRTIDAATPIETMPLFVRAGSILPMGPVIEYATERTADTLEVRIYAGANGKFELYEDENDGYGYEQGKSASIDFTWNDAQHKLVIGRSMGTFPGKLAHRVFNIVLVKDGYGAGLAPTTTFTKSVSYSGAPVEVLLH